MEINTSSSPADTAAQKIARDGYVKLGRILPEDLVDSLRREFDERYRERYLQANGFEDSLETGNRRYMITVELSGTFADARLYADDFILSILSKLLHVDFVLNNFGVVLSLPGAQLQHTHRDGPLPFGTEMGSILPAYAITVAIPLVDMNSNTGTTEFFVGSHRPSRWKECDPCSSEVPSGHCLMWDYRVLHRGTENRSTNPRPLIYLTYTRPWWHDHVNYAPRWTDSGPVRQQKKFLFGKGFFEGVAKEHRFLFANC
jgi:ectoine hydroxylase-related dioxygenase (phytanoyl-CoA dioxygenase family)